MKLCESCLASTPRRETPATTHSVNPDWSGYELCADCAAEYDARPYEHMSDEPQAGALCPAQPAPLTAGQRRAARKAARAAGQTWNVETNASGQLEQVRTRTSAEESRHYDQMERAARRSADNDQD